MVTGALGLEVRRLFQPPSASRFAPSEIEGFQQTVIREAEKLYRDAGAPPADVIVNFSGRDRHRQRASDLASRIADFVRDHRPGEKQITFYDAGDSTVAVPPRLTGINIASPLPGAPRPWVGSGVGQTILVSHRLVSQTIMEKDAHVGSYRAKAKQIWLLIVCDLFPASMSFAAPDDIGEWEFSFTFDKVLLLSRADVKVWPLRCTRSCPTGLASPHSAHAIVTADPDHEL